MASIDISAKDMDCVRTLIELIASYEDELPDELLNALHEFSDCDSFEFSNSDYQATGASFDSYKLVVNGVDRTSERGFVSVNKILKRVTRHAFDDDMKPLVEGNEFVYLHEYPESLTLSGGGIIMVEW